MATLERQEFSTLPKQFLITRKETVPPCDWTTFRYGDRYLFKSPELPVTHVIPKAEESADWSACLILGWFVYDGKLYAGNPDDRLITDATVDTLYQRMTGRFVIVCLEGPELRCVTDPGALLPVVYRRGCEEIGSTPRALALTEPLVDSGERRAIFSRKDGTAWYPFGMTPFSSIDRVLPATMLHLPSGEVRSMPETSHRNVKCRDAVEQIHGHAVEFIDALGERGTLESHLTAGWDSRMVLAAGLKSSANIRYLTYKVPGNNGSVDCLISRLIADRLMLSHTEVPLRQPKQEDIDAWIWRTADCIHDSVMKLTTTVEQTYADRFVLGGLAGEVGRAFYWNARDIGKRNLSAVELLKRLGFERTKAAVALGEEWLGNHAGNTMPQILDQAYIDLRLGGWGGPSIYGHPVSKPTLTPFNNASVFALMKTLPERYRLSGQFAKDFVSLGSPALVKIPVNRAQGLKRLRYAKKELASYIPADAKTAIKALAAR